MKCNEPLVNALSFPFVAEFKEFVKPLTSILHKYNYGNNGK